MWLCLFLEYSSYNLLCNNILFQSYFIRTFDQWLCVSKCLENTPYSSKNLVFFLTSHCIFLNHPFTSLLHPSYKVYIKVDKPMICVKIVKWSRVTKAYQRLTQQCLSNYLHCLLVFFVFSLQKSEESYGMAAPDISQP